MLNHVSLWTALNAPVSASLTLSTLHKVRIALPSCEHIKGRGIMVIHPFCCIRVCYVTFAYKECSVNVCWKSNYGENELIRPHKIEITSNYFLKSKYFRQSMWDNNFTVQRHAIQALILKIVCTFMVKEENLTQNICM